MGVPCWGGPPPFQVLLNKLGISKDGMTLYRLAVHTKVGCGQAAGNTYIRHAFYLPIPARAAGFTPKRNALR